MLILQLFYFMNDEIQIWFSFSFKECPIYKNTLQKHNIHIW